MTSRTKEWISIIAMLAAVGFFWMLLPARPESGASIFPNVLMGLMLLMAGVKVLTELFYPKDTAKKAAEKQPMGRFLFILVCLIVYVLVVDYVGFFVSSFIFFFGVTLAVQYEKRTPRSIVIRLIVVTGFLLFLWILFSKVLMAALPKGFLF